MCLGKDAGGRSDSAVHHTVENGEQAVQGKRFGSQKVVTCLQHIDIMLSDVKQNHNQWGVKIRKRCSPFHFSSRS